MAKTGGAVLRATGRVFLGLGPDPSSEADSPTEQEQEKADRPFPLMVVSAFVLAALAFAPGALARRYAATAIGPFFHPDGAAILGLAPAHDALPVAAFAQAPHGWIAWAAVIGSLGIAGFSLFRDKLPGLMGAASKRVFGPIFKGVEVLHSGLIGDYVTWIAVGFAAVGAAAVARRLE